MSQYNKTVLTHAGLELAKRANAGQAKFGITRAVTSADDWSNKTVQDLEEVTTIPNIMQQGIIMDTDEVESNNSVIGVSLCFTNKNLSTGYQIRIIGLYVKEEGQENDFLYAVTTAITPEYMPSFADKVLYRFNTQMYLVIGNAQSVNVVINEGTAVTSTQFNKYKGEVADNLKELENTHKEDMSHVAKSASINGGAEILPDSTGKLNLVVPDPDLSKYVSLEQLTEILQAKADKADTYTKSNIDDMHSKSYFRKQGMDQNGNTVEIRTNAVKQSNGGYAIDIYDTDWTAAKLSDVLAQLPNKANASDVSALQNSAMQVIDGNSGDDILSFRDEKIRRYNNVQNVKNLPAMSNINWFYVITHTKDGWGNVTVISQDNCYWQNVLKGSNWSGWVKHATSVDITSLQNQINANNNGTFTTGYDWNTATPTNQSRTLQKAWIVDQSVLRGAVDRMNSIDTNVNGRLPLGGGNMNLRSTINWYGGNINDKTGNLGGLTWAGGSDWAKIYGDQDGNDNLDLAFDLGDDSSNHFSFRNNGNEVAAIYSNGHFSGTVDWSNVSGRPDVATHADVNDLRNQVQQLRDSQFEVQTFTDANAAANWEAQRQGKRMAIVNS